MRLKQQVTSVAISNKLHKLGLLKPSIFYRDWTGAKEDEIEMWDNKDGDCCLDNINCYTIAELGEMLPPKATIDLETCDFFCWHPAPDLWHVGYYAKNEPILVRHSYNENTLVEAMGKMLIYLLENGLIK